VKYKIHNAYIIAIHNEVSTGIRHVVKGLAFSFSTIATLTNNYNELYYLSKLVIEN